MLTRVLLRFLRLTLSPKTRTITNTLLILQNTLIRWRWTGILQKQRKQLNGKVKKRLDQSVPQSFCVFSLLCKIYTYDAASLQHLCSNSPNILCWLAAGLSSRCCITTIVTAVGGASFRLSATLRCFENHNEEWVLFLYNFADVFENHEESGSQLQISILSNYKPFFGQNNTWPKGSSHFKVECDPLTGPVKGILYIWHMTMEIHCWKFSDPWKHT